MYFCSFKHRELYFYNFDLKVNEKYIIEPEITEKCETNTKQNPCIYAPSVKVALLTDLDHPYLHVHATKGDKVIVDQTLNICTIAKQSGLDLFGKLVLDMLQNNLNFELNCPFKKVKQFF